MKTSDIHHEFHDITGERKNQILLTCDKMGSLTGKATREECHLGNGLTHLAFLAFVIDKDGFILLTKRADRKSLWANFWDASVVSHILPGESPKTAAGRRGKEELGIDTEFKDLGAFYYFARHGGSCENEYCHVLTGNYSGLVYPNPVELGQTKNLTPDKLRKDISDHPQRYTPWLKSALRKFTIRP